MSVTGKETQHQKGINSAKEGFEQQCYTSRLYNDRDPYTLKQVRVERSIYRGTTGQALVRI